MGIDESIGGADVVRLVELVPDESITDAIGRGHTLTTALADIIDNSLDAKAENIRIRFFTEDDRVVAVRVRDDGVGMTPVALQDAMTLGKTKRREETDLGHFGIGLKAASLSQALTLTVYSRNISSGPCAMRIRRGSFRGEVLDENAAEQSYEWDASGPASTGTVVEWHHLETVNQSQLSTERRAWLDRTITSLLHSLGLTFHRLIQNRGIRITVDTWDIRVGGPGLPRTVEPRDPFQFHIWGHANYPVRISARMSDSTQVEADCFILPPRSDSPAAWLLGRNPAEWQGIYVYRNDRLLQAGGWLEVRQHDKRLRLARMRIDIDTKLERHLRLRHEKSGVTATPEFIAALESATNPDGVTLDTFRSDAAEIYRASNVKKQSVKPAVPLGSGLPERVIEAVREQIGERDDDPIRIEWKMLPEGRLYEMQHDRQLIRFNLGYRAALGGDNSAVIPTLVYLLLESYFAKSRLNQVTKDQINAWQAVTAAAMLAQLGDDSYDSLANWPKISHEPEPSLRAAIVAAPRPAPPSTELRWALLGQRGQIPPQEPHLADAWSDGPVAGEQPAVDLPLSTLTGVNSVIAESHPHVASVEASDAHREVKEPQVRAARQEVVPVHASERDREIVVMYRSRIEVDAIAAALHIDTREVAMRLCALVLDLQGDDIDDHELAAMHGMPYTPEERERIVDLHRDGKPIRWIAAHYSRTPFAIAWQLLTSPKRPVEVPKNLLRRIDRALAGAPAPDRAYE